MAEAAADRAAIAHRAIGDAARRRAACAPLRDVGNAPVLDVGVGDAGADHQLVAASFDLLQLGNAGDVDDQIAAATRRRLSIGPSDWPPAMHLAPRFGLAPAAPSAPARSRGRS